VPAPARLTAAFACLAVLLPIGACGGGSDEKKDVANAVHNIYNGLATKDADKVCGSLSKKGKERVVRATGRPGRRASCEAVFRLGFRFSGKAFSGADRAKVTQVKIDGDRAIATVELRHDTGDVALVKEGGDWKLEDLQSSGS
jgi:hypothetical protein